jgi:hypothetical protein
MMVDIPVRESQSIEDETVGGEVQDKVQHSETI